MAVGKLPGRAASHQRARSGTWRARALRFMMGPLSVRSRRAARSNVVRVDARSSPATRTQGRLRELVEQAVDKLVALVDERRSSTTGLRPWKAEAQRLRPNLEVGTCEVFR